MLSAARKRQYSPVIDEPSVVLKFWREPYEMTLFPDGRAIIKGTTDPIAARTLYARYIGN